MPVMTDDLSRYAQFVASRLDAAIDRITDPDQRAAIKAALGPAIALSGVCACGLAPDSPAIVRAMMVCALDMAGARPTPVSVSVEVPGPDGAQ